MIKWRKEEKKEKFNVLTKDSWDKKMWDQKKKINGEKKRDREIQTGKGLKEQN